MMRAVATSGGLLTDLGNDCRTSFVTSMTIASICMVNDGFIDVAVNVRPMLNSAIPIASPCTRSKPMGFASARNDAVES
jgi:hypothetical protein